MACPWLVHGLCLACAWLVQNRDASVPNRDALFFNRNRYLTQHFSYIYGRFFNRNPSLTQHFSYIYGCSTRGVLKEVLPADEPYHTPQSACKRLKQKPKWFEPVLDAAEEKEATQ